MGIGKVEQLQIFTEKGKPGTEVEQIETTENGGIKGDRHCLDEDGQISLITKEACQWMQEQEVEGLCFRRFKANMVLDIEEGTAIPKAELKIGDVVLKESKKQKSCFKECTRFQNGMDCKLREQSWFATALTKAQVRVGDGVSFVYNWNRYKRQVLVPGIGQEQQEKIKNASVLIVGAGGLGCPALTVLAEAGVGKIGLIDGDVVEVSNLNRQFLYTPSDLGKSKAECAGEWVKKFRPDCNVTVYPIWLTKENGRGIMQEYDLIIAAVDHISTRMMINQMAYDMEKPLIDGAIDGFYGTITAVLSKEAPCLACLNPEGKEPAHISSSLGTTTMIVGALEAQFAIQYLAGLPIKSGYVLSYDGILGTLEELPIQRNSDCQVCGNMADMTKM